MNKCNRDFFVMQAFGHYVPGKAASALKQRDYKDSTDLIVDSNNSNIYNKIEYRIRRLTPTECLRLQGLPAWWCNGVKSSDSAIFKMAGNGIAIPCAIDVLGRLADELDS